MQWLEAPNPKHTEILKSKLYIANSNKAVVKILATMGMAADINKQISHRFFHFCQENQDRAAGLPPNAKLFYTTGEPVKGEFYEVPFTLYHE